MSWLGLISHKASK